MSISQQTQKQNIKEQIQQLQKQSLDLDLKLLYTQTGIDNQPVIQKTMPQLQSLLINKLKNQESNINWPPLNPSNEITSKITKLQESYDEIENFTHQLQQKINNIKQDESYFNIQKLSHQNLHQYLEKFNEFQLQSICFSDSFQNQSYTQRFRNTARGKLPQKNASLQTFNLIETNISSQSQKLKNSKKSEQYLKAVKLQLIDMNISNICNDFNNSSNLNFYRILSVQFQSYVISNLDSTQFVYESKREILNNTVKYLEDGFWENHLIKYLNSKPLVSGVCQYLEDKYFNYEDGIRKSNAYFHDCLVNDTHISVCVWGVIYLLLRSGKYYDIEELISGTFTQFEHLQQSLTFFQQNLLQYCQQNHLLNGEQRYQILTTMTNDMSEDSQCVFKLQVYDILTRRGQSQDIVFTKDIEEYLWISLKQVIVNQSEEAAQTGEEDLSINMRNVSPIDWYYLKDFQGSINERQDCGQSTYIDNLCISMQYLQAFEQLKSQFQQGNVDFEDLIHFSFVVLGSKFYEMRDIDTECDMNLKLEMQRICEMFISKKFEGNIAEGFYYSIFLYNQDREILFEILSENVIKSKDLQKFIISDEYSELNNLLDQLKIYQEIQIHIADKLRRNKQNYSLCITIYDNFDYQIPMVQCISEYSAYLLQGDSNIDEQEFNKMELFIENYFINANKILQNNQQNSELYKEIRVATFMNFVKTLCINLHKNNLEQGCQFYNFILNKAIDLNILPENSDNSYKKTQTREIFLYLQQANYLDFYLDLWVLYTDQAWYYMQQFKSGQFVKSYTLSFQQLSDQISFYYSYFNEICNNNEQEFNRIKAKTHKIKDKFLQINNYL